MKVNIAGSGHDRWETHKGDRGAGWLRQDRREEKHDPVYFRNDKEMGRKAQIEYSGPTARIAKGGGLKLKKGLRDTGSNRIKRLVQNVPVTVMEIVNEQRNAGWENIEGDTVVMIKAHSRGAVAASQIARNLKRISRKLQVEVVMFDPVPGPYHEGDDKEIDLSSVYLDNSTLVYSVASGYSISAFDPQKVLGTNRIIISTQTHGAGLEHGFTYNEKEYTGTALNSLPNGVYFDLSKKEENHKAQLIQANSETEAEELLRRAQQGKQAKNFDVKRVSILKEVLKVYFRHLRSTPTTHVEAPNQFEAERNLLAEG